MKEQIIKFREYLDYIERHYDNVQKAWQEIKDKCRAVGYFNFLHDEEMFNRISYDVINHDLSKLSANEFTQYRQYFFPTLNEVRNKDLFDSAWAHHLENNNHHWQNWTVNSEKSTYTEICLIHNIIDWMAMGYEFGDTAKDYYENNKSKIFFPDWAVEKMYEIFSWIYPSCSPVPPL